MQQISEQEVFLLRQATRMVVRELGLLSDAYFDIGITLAERHLLIELEASVDPDVGTMAERLLLDKSSASRLIARAVKKGFIAYTVDDGDKRRRGLQLTDHGRQTLAAFEQLAQKQVIDALLTLSAGEAETVHRGVTLFAKGLAEARLSKLVEDKLEQLSGQFSQCGCQLISFRSGDEPGLYAIFRTVVEAGGQFPYESSSIEEFKRLFLTSQSRVFVCKSKEGEIIGGFYLRTNFPDHSESIANAAYMIGEQFRGRGIGRRLIEASLELAKVLGYRAMQYNMVLSENSVAIDLYRKLGFETMATIPRAGSDRVGYVMYRKI